MQISKVDSVSMNTNNSVNAIPTKNTGEFAQQLASATEKAQQAKDDAKLKATCQDMEAMFLNMMMADMRKTVQKSKLVDTSTEDMMTSMLDSEMTKNMASAGGMGLGDMIYRQLRLDASAVKKPQAL